MSGTYATISILKSDKTVKTIGTNYDGDFSRTGKTLNSFYTGIDSVDRLISNGNISTLYSTENNSDCKPPKIYSNKKEYIENVQYSDYNYLFKEENQTWYAVKGNKTQKLSEVLEKAVEKIKTKKMF